MFSWHAIGEPAIDGHFTGSRGCTVNYQIYEPERPTASHPLILTHGFMRNLHTLTDWGTQLSALGFRVVLVSLCNSSWLSGRHHANARDLVAARRHLGFNSVIYGGFSAGGLSAYLAALNDPSTAGYIGLDAVDSGNLALNSPAAVRVPALFVTAPASACNADGNFKQVMSRVPAYDAVALTEANHCSFEMPNDRRCNWICGRLSEAQTKAAQHQIFAAVVGWLQQHFSDTTGDENTAQ
jgi:pimeloyl-ACP methyl ester carboxylesterase